MEWKKLSEKTFRAGWRKMINKKFLLPNGKEQDFDIKDEGPAVCGVVLTEKNEIVMVKQYRPGPEKILIELPGGVVENGETPEEAMCRELLEETGYAGNIELVGTCYDCAYSTMKRYCFVVKNAKKVQDPELDENEFIELLKINLDEFRKLLRSGEMTDVEVGYLALDYLGCL